MDVFISWSGKRSREVAIALTNWLPKVNSGIKPWTSTAMERGKRWRDEMATRLENANAGIICLTPANLHSDWILFESGALSNKICLPFLVGVDRSDLTSPLNEFQCTHPAERAEVWMLLKRLNDTSESDSLPEGDLLEAFNLWWPKLDRQLTQLNQELLPDEDFQVNVQVLDADMLFQRAKKEVLAAKERIFVVANYTLPQRPNPEALDAREEYYSTLWDKVVQSDIKYKRIVQLPHRNADTMKYAHSFVRHLGRCIKELDSNSKVEKNVRVYQCIKEQQLTSFLLIDRSTVFIEFYVLVDQPDGNKCCQLDSGIVIRGGKILRIFEEIFDKLRDESSQMKPEDVIEFEKSLVPI